MILSLEEKMFDTMDEKEWVLKAIGKTVSFMYPEPERKLEGILRDRYAHRVPSLTKLTDYWDVIDLIEFKINGKKIKAIRFGYYRRTKGKLIWGSQTTLTEEINKLKELFKGAAREKKWFKQFLKEIVEEI